MIFPATLNPRLLCTRAEITPVKTRSAGAAGITVVTWTRGGSRRTSFSSNLQAVRASVATRTVLATRKALLGSIVCWPNNPYRIGPALLLARDRDGFR